MTTANEAWMDALIRHQVGLMRIAPGITAKVNSLLNSSEADMVKAIEQRYGKGLDPRRLQNLLKTIQAARSDAWKKVNKTWKMEMEDLAKAEPHFLDETLRAVAPVQLGVTLPTAERLASIASSTPFEGRVLSDWASRVEASDLDRIEQQIKIGMLQGENIAQMTRRIVGTVQMKGTDGVTQITRNNADSITRTAVNAISNAAKQEFYAQNADVLDQEVFLATLDARTTLVCAGNDNKIYERGKGPIPPLHWRCRSLRLAIINGEVLGDRPAKPTTERMLVKEYAEKNKLGNLTLRTQLPKGHKGSFDAYKRQRIRDLTGRVPAKLSYDEWLRKQSKDYQDEVLGPARAKLFREGLKLDKFTDKQGETLTLAQLRKQEGGSAPPAPAAPPAPKTPPPPAPTPAAANTEAQLRKQASDAEAAARKAREDAAKAAAAAKARELALQQKLEALQAQQQPPGVDIRKRVRMDEKNPFINAAQQEELLKVLDDAGWSKLQAEIGGDSSIVLRNKLSNESHNGLMYPRTGTIDIKMNRPPGTYDTTWSASASMHDTMDKIKSTAVHEFGHVVHLYKGNTMYGLDTQRKADDIIKKVWGAPGREFLTKYAETNHMEYFAESFAKYHQDADALKAIAPKAHQMVQDVLKARNLSTKPLNLKKAKPSAPAPKPVARPTWASSPPPAEAKPSAFAQRYGKKTDAEVFQYLSAKARDPFGSMTHEQLIDYRYLMGLGFK